MTETLVRSQPPIPALINNDPSMTTTTMTAGYQFRTDRDAHDPWKARCNGDRDLTMVSGSAYLPKRSVSRPLGEDAHFICHREQTMGVADGVGGWALKGIDAGEYARELMKNTARAVQCKHQERPFFREDIDPSLALKEAFRDTVVPGSCTACVVTLQNDNVLHGINVGDSGFLVLREGDVVYKSPAQQSRFNCPYQLGLEKDNPSVGEELRFGIQAWDIIVMGTDGLFDNVFGSEIEYLVHNGVEESEKPAALAMRIAKYALDKAEDEYCATPFAEAAREAGKNKHGGKYDDITVVVAFVIPSILLPPL